MNISEFINGITSGAFDGSFRRLYGRSGSIFLRYRAGYISAAERFSWLYPECGELRIFSVPGEITLIGGDRQRGASLSAAAGCDIAALVSANDDGIIRIAYEGGEEAVFSMDKPEISKGEQGRSAELIKAVAAEFPAVGGISCYIFPKPTDENRAAAALLLASIMNAYSNSGKTAAELAVIAAKAADSEYESCMVSALGGFVLTDSANQRTDCIPFDMETAGYTLCIADTSEGSLLAEHDLAGISDEDEFYAELPELRKSFTDEELLSAAYFLGESRRAAQSAEMLKNGDTEGFFEIVNEAPELYAAHKAALAYTAGRRSLGGCGALKISGGRLLAFVPNYRAEEFTEEMNLIFGESFCRIMKLRPVGIYEINGNV